jgi:hypothetical protein
MYIYVQYNQPRYQIYLTSMFYTPTILLFLPYVQPTIWLRWISRQHIMPTIFVVLVSATQAPLQKILYWSTDHTWVGHITIFQYNEMIE